MIFKILKKVVDGEKTMSARVGGKGSKRNVSDQKVPTDTAHKYFASTQDRSLEHESMLSNSQQWANQDSCDLLSAQQIPSGRPKKAKKPPALAERINLPWNDITHMLGYESTTALGKSIAQLKQISQDNASIAVQISAVIEQLEQARRTALITLQLVQSRTIAEHETGYVSLRQVVLEVIAQRTKWLEKRQIKISVGPLDARLVANITALFLLIDELVSWAAKLAPEVVVAINTTKLNRAGIQLLVYAKFGHNHVGDAEWTNVGWYLWHKLATAVGGSAELNVMDEALCVSVTFTPAAAPGQADNTPEKALRNPMSLQRESTQRFRQDAQPVSAIAVQSLADKSRFNMFSGHGPSGQASVRELSHARDIAEIVKGCHVIVIVSELKVRNAVVSAVASLGLHIQVVANVRGAMVFAERAQVPHAVIFSSKIQAGEMLQLRHDWASMRKTAYLELCDAEDAQTTSADAAGFHFTSVGSMSTAHVVIDAIPESLAPALVFELCKVL